MAVRPFVSMASAARAVSNNENRHVSWLTAWGPEHEIQARVGFAVAQFMRGRDQESLTAALQNYDDTEVLPVELKAAAVEEDIDERHFHSQLREMVVCVRVAGK